MAQAVGESDYDNIIFTLGYPKKDDKNRKIIKPWVGYEMKEIIHVVFIMI